jgi:hypothetical protein
VWTTLRPIEALSGQTVPTRFDCLEIHSLADKPLQAGVAGAIQSQMKRSWRIGASLQSNLGQALDVVELTSNEA